MWLARHDSTPHNGGSQTTLEAATAAGWPASCGDDSVLFLDDLPIYMLLAQASVGRTVTLLVGTVAAPGEPRVQKIGVAPSTMQPEHAAVDTPPRLNDGGIMPSEEVVRAVQQDAWEQPRSAHAPPSAEREPAVGDRIIIRQGRRPITALLGQIGTVVEIFRAPRDSCLVHIDGDRDGQREWFFYHDEVTLCTA
jgi:hypothetical protein